jgi:6-phosphofructokinase 1
MDEVCEHITKRYEERDKRFSIIVVAEGAKIYEVADPDLGETDAFGHVRLDRRDIGKQVQRGIEARLPLECRSVVLGHLQRGGSPTVFDRVLATRLGVRAVDMIKQGWFGQMVALQGNRIVPIPLRDVAGRTKQLAPEFWDLATIFY